MNAYLFDLGNVLLKFDFSKTYQRLRQHGASLERMKSPEMAVLGQAYEIGQLSDSGFLRAASALIGYRGDEAAFRHAWQDIFEVNEPMTDFLAKCREQGAACYLLSNSNGMHVQFIRERYTILAHFDGLIFSHEVGCMKPEDRIYHLAIERFGLRPEATLYIDDAGPNIEAGQRLGFQCIRYLPDDHAAFTRAAQAMGVL